jgi:hypothetical protein
MVRSAAEVGRGERGGEAGQAGESEGKCYPGCYPKTEDRRKTLAFLPFSQPISPVDSGSHEISDFGARHLVKRRAPRPAAIDRVIPRATELAYWVLRSIPEPLDPTRPIYGQNSAAFFFLFTSVALPNCLARGDWAMAMDAVPTPWRPDQVGGKSRPEDRGRRAGSEASHGPPRWDKVSLGW